jgi:hypothetical protein
MDNLSVRYIHINISHISHCTFAIKPFPSFFCTTAAATLKQVLSDPDRNNALGFLYATILLKLSHDCVDPKLDSFCTCCTYVQVPAIWQVCWCIGFRIPVVFTPGSALQVIPKHMWYNGLQGCFHLRRIFLVLCKGI